jgi:hypothetical protein
MIPDFCKGWFAQAKDKLIKLADISFIVKLIVLIGLWVLALLPIWVTWGAWAIISPETDLVRAAIILGALFVLGIPQIVFIIAAVFLSIALILEDL